MISITHTLFALAVLTKKETPLRNRAAFLGSVIPDAFIYVVALGWTLFSAEPMSRLWDEVYFDQPMQSIASAFNSIPIYALLALLGYFYRRTKAGIITLFLSLAALLHISMDLPVHAHDAYAHFWPITQWKFHSPISYWEPHLQAHWVGLIETAIALGSAWMIARRFEKAWITVLMLILAILYIAMITLRWIALV